MTTRVKGDRSNTTGVRCNPFFCRWLRAIGPGPLIARPGTAPSASNATAMREPRQVGHGKASSAGGARAGIRWIATDFRCCADLDWQSTSWAFARFRGQGGQIPRTKRMRRTAHAPRSCDGQPPVETVIPANCLTSADAVHSLCLLTIRFPGRRPRSYPHKSTRTRRSEWNRLLDRYSSSIAAIIRPDRPASSYPE